MLEFCHVGIGLSTEFLQWASPRYPLNLSTIFLSLPRIQSETVFVCIKNPSSRCSSGGKIFVLWLKYQLLKYQSLFLRLPNYCLTLFANMLYMSPYCKLWYRHWMDQNIDWHVLSISQCFPNNQEISFLLQKSFHKCRYKEVTREDHHVFSFFWLWAFQSSWCRGFSISLWRAVWLIDMNFNVLVMVKGFSKWEWYSGASNSIPLVTRNEEKRSSTSEQTSAYFSMYYSVIRWIPRFRVWTPKFVNPWIQDSPVCLHKGMESWFIKKLLIKYLYAFFGQTAEQVMQIQACLTWILFRQRWHILFDAMIFGFKFLYHGHWQKYERCMRSGWLL